MQPFTFQYFAAHLLVIFFVCGIGYRIIKSANKRSVIRPTPQWSSASYHIYISSLIKSALTDDDLSKTKVLVNGYRETSFVDQPTKREVNRRYDQLIDAYIQKKHVVSIIQGN